MRIYFALAFLMTAAAAPGHAQRAQPVHHGDGFDVVLPTRCRPMPMQGVRITEEGVETHLVAMCENTLVMVMRHDLGDISDTTVATRRAMLHLARVGMLHAAASGGMEMVGEPRDFERDDRVGMRLSVTMPAGKERGVTLYGTAELSAARRGDVVMWVVMVFDRRRGATAVAANERVLDSFHVTGAGPSVAEKESDREHKGFVGGAALKAEP